MNYCKKTLKSFIIIIACILMTGCYDRKELDDYAYIIALGIDKGSNGLIRVTFQSAVPIQIAGENSKAGKETFTTLSIESESFYTAISKINASTTKEVNLSHVKMVVFSEELARGGLGAYISTFATDQEVKPHTHFLISETSADEFLKNINPVLEVNPAKYYELLMTSYSYTGYTIDSELISFYSAVQSPFQESVALIATLDERKKAKNCTRTYWNRRIFGCNLNR